ncbi:hypothetical protein [Caulobacter segnis]
MLVVSVMIFRDWLEAPLAHKPSAYFSVTLLAIFGLKSLLDQPRIERMIGRLNVVEPGVWATARPERLRRLAVILFTIALLPPLAKIGWAHWQAGDGPRLAGAAVAILLLLFGIARFTLRVWRMREELRIDADGVFAPDWPNPVAWDAIDFAVRPRNARELTLMLKSAGLRTVALAPTGLYPDEALAALHAVRPDLRIEPWTLNGFVLPIHGATDVADPVKVTTYG